MDDNYKVRLSQMTNEQLWEEYERTTDLEKPEYSIRFAIENEMDSRSGASEGDINTDYFYCRMEMDKIYHRVNELKKILKILKDDLIYVLKYIQENENHSYFVNILSVYIKTIDFYLKENE